MAKETYLYGKTDLQGVGILRRTVIRQVRMWQKRPIYMAKETYIYGKRGLFIWQKRPIYMAKEAC